MTGPYDPIVVRWPQALADHAGGARTLTVDATADGRLRDVVDQLTARVPAVARRVVDETGSIRRFVNVYVGEEECRRLHGLETPVPAGSVVYIVGSVAGG